ncbi:MAG: hypothetical protein JNM72_02520 [Deltaproteobacteria bacterium]|nr:hypothetical protein [Deltaproteobacteria bacterium]
MSSSATDLSRRARSHRLPVAALSALEDCNIAGQLGAGALLPEANL